MGEPQQDQGTGRRDAPQESPQTEAQSGANYESMDTEAFPTLTAAEKPATSEHIIGELGVNIAAESPSTNTTPSADGTITEFAAEAVDPADSTSKSALEPQNVNADVDVSSSISPQGNASGFSSSAWRPVNASGRNSAAGDFDGDRVYPIRSIISMDNSNPTPWTLSRSTGDNDYFARHETTWDGRHRGSVSTEASGGLRRGEASSPAAQAWPAMGGKSSRGGQSRKSGQDGHVDNPRVGPPKSNMFNDQFSDDSDAIADNLSVSTTGSNSENSAPAEVNENFVTARFKHVVTEDGHAVITGRDGVLQSCEDEPIHAPGAVQQFGLLVAIREEGDGRFSVRVASENSKRILGYSPSQLFRLTSFLDIFTEEQADNLLDHIDFIRDDDTDPATNGPEVFSLSLRPPGSRSVKLWCAMHTSASDPDLIICEFELEDDAAYPLRPPEKADSTAPEDTLYQNPTVEEFNESTEISSRPLRVLRNARSKRGEAGAMQVFDMMSQVQDQLASAPNLEQFLKVLVGIIKELTGFHRVMIYQFDAAFNGKVVTELVDPSHTRDLYKGLHFPASDIPKQARELYKINKVRLLYDRDLETARLVCRTVDDLARPLDLTHSYLRAMSPIHLKYLTNMGVRASMSISINAFNELWGLISCHTYGASGMRVSFPVRKMCRLVGDNASRNIERLSYASRLQARKLINTVPTDKNPSGYIIASSDDLLQLFDADFGMLSIRGETKIMGKTEQTQEGLALLEYLRVRKFTSVMTTQDVREDFPDLRYPPGFTFVAGFLYVPLSVGGQDFIVFFRKGQVREVKWAGNPYEKFVKEGTSNYLEPRTSFQVWHETVIGKCRDWSEEQVETAAVLCLVYGKFIEVWRQKEAALQNSRLTRLLLANSAHEVRTPLNAIINYLEIALEGTLDHETRDNLAKSHSASKSLIYVINDLLDLTKTEEGRDLIKDEILDLSLCLREATDPFKVDAKRKAITYEVIEHQGLPKAVHGDHRRIRQAIANLTANAFQHTSKGFVRIECYVTEVIESRVRIEVSIQDSGAGMSNSQLDALFREMEQVSSDSDDAVMEDEVEKSRGTRTLGLGLAVVARTVRNMDGQLRLKSEEGKGSRFVIQMPFEIPTAEGAEEPTVTNDTIQSSGASIQPSVTTSLPPAQLGEVTLVHQRSTTNLQQAPSAKASFEDTHSISSLRSGASRESGQSNRSDADRLIDAIQTPLPYGEPESDSVSLRRKNSKDSAQSQTRVAGTLKVASQAGKTTTTTTTTTTDVTSSANSAHALQHHEESSPAPAGLAFVTDSKTPVKPVKVPDEFGGAPSMHPAAQTSRVSFEMPTKSLEDKGNTSSETAAGAPSSGTLRVLIAEDDPINMRILKKRLEKAGHVVSPTVNGEDCAAVYSENSQNFDVILMDMQMPIVDGLTSAKMIRDFERSEKCPGISALATRQGRVPIFAVSASLVEKEKPTYVDAGFDGWILKPIEFTRLHTFLAGISDDAKRNAHLYAPGQWERGGWFVARDETSSAT